MSNTERMIIVDVGSTTTKALLFQRHEGIWSLCQRGEAPTTVEAPTEDVMVGVERAIRMLEQRSGIAFVAQEAGERTDSHLCLKDIVFLATSSAGGGLKIVVCGNVRNLSALSAERAALGGGAILLDVFGSDDGLNQFQRLERLRALRPDMILLSGGVEGAQVITFIIEMCDFIRSLRSTSKFGDIHKLPVIYAGASSGAPVVEDLLGKDFRVQIVPNLKPNFECENLEPTREAIHELFIEHVMSNAPGYDTLQRLVDADIMPTPSAVGEILTRFARKRQANLLCVDIGGATTDIFSVMQGNYVRSVSANYGMSYSIGQVYSVAGYAQVERWLEQPMTEAELMRRVGSKLFNPTTIPAVADDLSVEQAMAREALRLAFEDHLKIALVQKARGIFGPGLIDKPKQLHIGDFDLIIGSGGVLSNAPQRAQAAAVLLDAFQPIGVTELMVDSVFMLPHLGVFAQMDEESALHILEKDCLIPLGTALAPEGRLRPSELGLTLKGMTSGKCALRAEVYGGEICCLPLAADETAELQLSFHREAHWSGPRSLTVRGGQLGIIIDLRGRPLPIEKHGERHMAAWRKAFTMAQGEGNV